MTELTSQPEQAVRLDPPYDYPGYRSTALRAPKRPLIAMAPASAAAGRYAHETNQHDAPLDPNFSGAGRCLTDDDGHYRFVTIRPGEYPWLNHPNAWRPAHVHFSVFGDSFTSRLVTQMYFPGDPLLAHDPMFQSIRDRGAAETPASRPSRRAAKAPSRSTAACSTGTVSPSPMPRSSSGRSCPAAFRCP